MKSAHFKVFSRVSDTETNSQMIQELEAVVFAKDENGNGTPGTAWGIHKRIDDDYLEIGISTTDEVMDMILQDHRLELVKKLDGWPEETESEEPE